MSFSRHPHNDQDGFLDASHSFNLHRPAPGTNFALYPDHHPWEEPYSHFTTCHLPENCRECANYEEHLAFSSLSFSAHHLSGSPTPPPASSFDQGVHVGRRLQREEDEDIFSRYRSRLHHAQNKHVEAHRAHIHYRAEVELLRKELATVKDRLLAVHIAYEDLAMARLDDHGYFPSFAVSDRSDLNVDDSDGDSLPARPGPSLATSSVIQETPVPRVVRDARQYRDGFDQNRYFLDDEDEFEAWQQLHLMQEREDATERFWSDFRPGNSSDLSSNDNTVTSGPSGSDSDSPPSSISPLSSPSLSVEDFSTSSSSSSSPTALPKGTGPTNTSCLPLDDLVTSAVSTTDHDIAQLSALMSAAHQYNFKGTEALKRVKALIKLAEAVPKEHRSPAQLYLLTHWKRKRRRSMFSISTAPTGGLSSSLSSFSSSPPPPALSLNGHYSEYDQSSSELSGSGCGSEIFVDASGQGVGLVFNGCWLSWTFTPSHPAIPIGPDGNIVMSWAELIAVELGLLTFLAGPSASSTSTVLPSPHPASASSTRILLVRSDNDGVVKALHTRSWTDAYGLSTILSRILKRAEDNGVEIKTKWVWTKANPADGPSRGLLQDLNKERMLSWIPSEEAMRSVGLEGVVKLLGRD